MKEDIGGIKVLIYAVALLFDFLQGLVYLTPFIGLLGFLISPFISMVALFVFWAWFRMYDIHIFDRDYVRGTLPIFFWELFPFINGAPGWWAFVKYVLYIHKRLPDGV